MKLQTSKFKIQKTGKRHTPAGDAAFDLWNLEFPWILDFEFWSFPSSASKPQPLFPHRRHSGISLLECLVYIAVLSVVAAVALIGFNRCWDDSKRLRHNADDIVRALHAGEQWRADLRAATGAIQVDRQNDGEKLVIPVPAGQIVYDYARGELLRETGAGAKPAVVLDRVKSSQMRADRRQHVAAWRWELELVPGQKKARTVPLFTFEVVAGHSIAQ